MIESINLPKSTKEWVIYHIRADGYRKPIGLFFGEFFQSESTVQWVKRGNTTIEILPTSPSDAAYKQRLTVLHALNQTIFRIVPNPIKISAAFSGEKGCVYYFETSGKLMVSGKLRIDHKGDVNTYEGRHSLYIDGISVITIRNGLVVIDCRSGELYLDETLPNQYRTLMNIQFPRRPRSRQRSTRSQGDQPLDEIPVLPSDTRPEAPAGWRRMDARDGYYLLPKTFFGEPLVTKQRQPSEEERRRMYTDVQEYVIYYNSGSNVRPIATFVGRIGAQTTVQTYYEHRRNDGSIRTVLLNINDTFLLRDAAIVTHSSDLIVVSANDNAIVKVYGEISGGFGFASDSVLKIKGRLVVSRRTDTIVEDPPIPGISSVTVNIGCVSIIIGDNNEIILLDEGQNNYMINHVSDGSQLSLLSDESSRQSVRPQVSPMQTTLSQSRDTGYESDSETSYRSTSLLGQSNSRSLYHFETEIPRHNDRSPSRQTSSPTLSLSLHLSEIRDHQRQNSTSPSIRSETSSSMRQMNSCPFAKSRSPTESVSSQSWSSNKE